jgi:hypothetical protein
MAARSEASPGRWRRPFLRWTDQNPYRCMKRKDHPNARDEKQRFAQCTTSWLTSMRERISAWFRSCRCQPIQMRSECHKADNQRNPRRRRAKISEPLWMQYRCENKTGDQPASSRQLRTLPQPKKQTSSAAPCRGSYLPVPAPSREPGFRGCLTPALQSTLSFIACWAFGPSFRAAPRGPAFLREPGFQL